jgi:hypothetical protein
LAAPAPAARRTVPPPARAAKVRQAARVAAPVAKATPGDGAARHDDDSWTSF